MVTTKEIGDIGVEKAIKILRRHGFKVYREWNQSESWDLIAEKNKKRYAIEVKYQENDFGHFLISTAQFKKLSKYNIIFMLIHKNKAKILCEGDLW